MKRVKKERGLRKEVILNQRGRVTLVQVRAVRERLATSRGEEGMISREESARNRRERLEAMPEVVML